MTMVRPRSLDRRTTTSTQLLLLALLATTVFASDAAASATTTTTATEATTTAFSQRGTRTITTRDVPAVPAIPAAGAAVSSRQQPLAASATPTTTTSAGASTTALERRTGVGVLLGDAGDDDAAASTSSTSTSAAAGRGREVMTVVDPPRGGVHGEKGAEEAPGGASAGGGVGLGLVPCRPPPAPPGCFVLRTPFPPDGGVFAPAATCTLSAPPLVTLDGAPLEVLRYDFDGADATFEVDIRAAILATEAVAADDEERPQRPPQQSLLSLQARAQLSCPKETYDETTAEALARGGGDGRVSWIFPFNFFLVEEIALLGDSIESLVEAVDNLQITVTGDDGSEEFLYGDGAGGFVYYPLLGNTREGEEDEVEVKVDPGAALELQPVDTEMELQQPQGASDASTSGSALANFQELSA